MAFRINNTVIEPSAVIGVAGTPIWSADSIVEYPLPSLSIVPQDQEVLQFNATLGEWEYVPSGMSVEAELLQNMTIGDPAVLTGDGTTLQVTTVVSSDVKSVGAYTAIADTLVTRGCFLYIDDDTYVFVSSDDSGTYDVYATVVTPSASNVLTTTNTKYSPPTPTLSADQNGVVCADVVDASNGKFVMSWSENGISLRGVALGTVSGTVITFNDRVDQPWVANINEGGLMVIGVSTDRCIITGNSNACYGCSTSGDTITFGAAATFATSPTNNNPGWAGCKVGTNKFARMVNTGSGVTMQIGTLDTGTLAVTLGASVVIDATGTSGSCGCVHISDDRILIAYHRTTTSIYVRVVTVSGTVPTAQPFYEITTVSVLLELGLSAYVTGSVIYATVMNEDPGDPTDIISLDVDATTNVITLSSDGTTSTSSTEDPPKYGTNSAIWAVPTVTGRPGLFSNMGSGYIGFEPSSLVDLRTEVRGAIAATGTAGETKPVQVSGIASGYSSLSVGSPYYILSDGSLTTTFNLFPLGIAISSTEIMLD